MDSLNNLQPTFTKKFKKADLQELKNQLENLDSLLADLRAPMSIRRNIEDMGKTIRWLENYVQRF